MENKIIVSLATTVAAVVLVGGAATLGGMKLRANHLQNMKVCSEFNNLKLTGEQLRSKHFENVKRFVDANGKGTLIAKRIDKCGNLAFIYYGQGETVDVSKNSIVSKDWDAVHEYVNWCSKATPKVLKKSSKNSKVLKSRVGSEKNHSDSVDKEGSKKIEQECSKLPEDAQEVAASDGSACTDDTSKESIDAVDGAVLVSEPSAGSDMGEFSTDSIVIHDVPTEDEVIKPESEIGECSTGSIVIHDVPTEDEETGTVVFKNNGDDSEFAASAGVGCTDAHEDMGEDSEPQMSDVLKAVLDDLGMTKEDLDRVLHVFFVAKSRYKRTQFYSKCGLPLEEVHHSLGMNTEPDMVRAFYGERFWYFWKNNIAKTIGSCKIPNAVVGCYFWVSRLSGGKQLSEELNMPREDVVANVRRFVEILYKLTGVDEQVKELFEEARRSPSPTSPTHMLTPSSVW